MANTTNFGWETPDDTDLVKDGAAAMRTLGNAIDASFVDLKGGTTNQVLAKNSNTDLDFKWVADASGIPATIFDAKGDIIAATAADTADRLAVGANGTVLTADTSTATGLKWAAASTGALTLISRQTFSNVASGSFEGVFSSTYDTYMIIVEKVFSSSSATSLQARLLYSTNTEQASNYYGYQIRISSSLTQNAGSNVNQIDIADQNSSNTNQAGRHTIWLNMVNNQGSPQINSTGMSGDVFTPQIMSYLNTNSRSYTGIKFFMSGGNISATIAIYGVAK